MSLVSQRCSCASQGCFWPPAPQRAGIFLCSAIFLVSPAAFLTVPMDCAFDNETFLMMSQPIVSYNLQFHFPFAILLCDIFNLISLKVRSRQIMLRHVVGKTSCKCGRKSLFGCGHVLVAAADMWYLARRCLLHLAGECGYISPSRLLRTQG